MKGSLLSLSLLFSFITKAQYNDAGIWVSATAEKNINQRLSVSLAPQLRFYENVTELYKYFADAGVSYKLKNFKFSFFYRLMEQRRVDDSYSQRHRFFADIAYKIKSEKVSLTYRFRYQNQFSDIGASSDWMVPSKYIRNKVSIKYLTDGKFQPFINADLWYNIKPAKSQFNNFRVSAGVAYELNKFSSFDAAYMINKEINSKNPTTSYILTLGYNYSF
jgi:hypothetical protein